MSNTLKNLYFMLDAMGEEGRANMKMEFCKKWMPAEIIYQMLNRRYHTEDWGVGHDD